MNLETIFSHWTIGRRVSVNAVAVDANELIEVWGALAHGIASDLSWREDSGLIHYPYPGY